jgi:ribose transport system substrate-binding protein
MKKYGLILLIAVFVVSMAGFGVGCKASTDTTAAAETTAAVTTAAAETTAAVTTAAAETTAPAAKKWKIALSNSYVGNEWRQAMQKVAEYVAMDALYKDKVDFKVVNCENTPEAQSASIDALVLEGYNAILLDASSPTAINQSVERAADAGVVIVNFDSLVNSEKVYKLVLDWYKAGSIQAMYLAEAIGGKGNMVVDRGLAGIEISKLLYTGAMDVFAKYPDIKVVHEFDGQFSEGETLAGMNAAIAAVPKIDAVYTQGFPSAVIQALKEAGRPLIPNSGWSYNSSLVALAENNCDGIVADNSPGSSARALQMAVDILEGSTDYKVNVNYDHPAGYFAMNPDTLKDSDVKIEKIEIGVNTFPDAAPGFQIVTLVPEIGVKVTQALYDYVYSK